MVLLPIESLQNITCKSLHPNLKNFDQTSTKYIKRIERKQSFIKIHYILVIYFFFLVFFFFFANFEIFFMAYHTLQTLKHTYKNIPKVSGCSIKSRLLLTSSSNNVI